MPDREVETRELAERHYAVEGGVTDIFILRDTENGVVEPDGNGAAQREPIRLLEVNENTVPTGIYPIQFAPAPTSGIHFSSVIVEITPEEFKKIQNDELHLPNGWEIGERIPNPQAARE
ncbi:MAG TPA: hypothetical protein VFI31_03375 [Pirellulales bacterium]|nr:hypothetical protein [Pirellulales bacterium]